MDEFLNLSGFLRAIRTIPPLQIALEMLMIGVVVFWTVRFLRGTRGARLLKGIAVVLISLYIIVRLLGSNFGLQRVEFLYSKFLYLASLAIIVVFQPELRRALMRLGETRLFRGWSHQIDEEIASLVETATYCSRRKIGALVAIERGTPLGGLAEESKATRLNA